MTFESNNVLICAKPFSAGFFSCKIATLGDPYKILEERCFVVGWI
jgi:hypothetical protein